MELHPRYVLSRSLDAQDVRSLSLPIIQLERNRTTASVSVKCIHSVDQAIPASCWDLNADHTLLLYLFLKDTSYLNKSLTLSIIETS
jgi:hypothetical protein